MKRLNKKGFSMVELLAVIVILGILGTIAIVSISAILNRAEKNHYATQEKNMIMAAESYAQDNRNVLPKEIGDTRTITLQELQNRKYIGTVVDRSKNDCTTGEVTIFKYSQNGYSYRVHLKCPKYETGQDQYEEDGPTIDLKLNNSYTDPYFTYAITTTGDNKIISYSYQIYKSGILVRDSGSVPVSREGEIPLKKESLKEYVPGEIEVIFKATNVYGYSSTKKVSGNIVPENAPECIISDATTNYTEDDWRRHDGPVEVTVGCKDKNGNGCAKEIFSQLFYDDTKTGSIEIVDNDGIKNSCTVGVYIDNTPPTKPVLKNDYENIWTNKSYTITATSKDETGGIKNFQYRYPNSSVPGENAWHDYPNSSSNPGEEKTFVTPAFSKERNEYVEIRACDYAGNCSEAASSMIKIDKTAPVITLSLNGTTGNPGWYISNVNISIVTSDVGGSDIAGYGLSTSATAVYNSKTSETQSTNTDGIIWYGYAKDVAGNTAVAKSDNFKVDPTAPEVSFAIANPKATSTNLTATCTDNESGVVTPTYTVAINSPSASQTVTCTNKAGATNTVSKSYNWSNCATGEPNHCEGGYDRVTTSGRTTYDGICHCRGASTGSGYKTVMGDCNKYSGACICPSDTWSTGSNCSPSGFECPSGYTASGGSCSTQVWNSCKTTTNTCEAGWK